MTRKDYIKFRRRVADIYIRKMRLVVIKHDPSIGLEYLEALLEKKEASNG